MNIELANQIYKDFIAIKNKFLLTIEYREEVIKWVQKYHEYEEEFRYAIMTITSDNCCIPDGKLLISCSSSCSRCHLYLPKKLINKINYPYYY